MPEGSQRPVPLFTVVIGADKLARVCELASGTVVTPGSVAPWAAEGFVERVVFDGPSRVIDVGVRRRLFAGAIQRAIEVRDGECYHAYCDLPAHRCEIDHIKPYTEGASPPRTTGAAPVPTTTARGTEDPGGRDRRGGPV